MIRPNDLAGVHDNLAPTKLFRLEFIVPGTPAGSGSKSAYPMRSGPRAIRGPLVFRGGDPEIIGGHVYGTPVITTADSCRASPGYRKAVHRHAAAAYGGQPLRTPVVCEFVCFFKRPSSQIGTGKNAGVLKASAPAPDLCRRGHDYDKIQRSLNDGMEGVVFVGDRQAVGGLAKRWISPNTFADDRDWLAVEDFTFVRVTEMDDKSIVRPKKGDIPF